jgi:hypothetical protein
MKRIILAVALCCAFSVHGIAANSAAILKRIEMLEKKINALKAERISIEDKRKLILSETSVGFKKIATLKDKIKSITSNPEFHAVSYHKAKLEKSENVVKILTAWVAADKFLPSIDKVNLNIGKANIELIKAEIKARKTPKVPLELAKALIKRSKAFAKLGMAAAKIKQAELKEEEAKIKYLESWVEINEKVEEIIKNTNSSNFYIYLTNIEIAELEAKQNTLTLKLEQARRETARVRINVLHAEAEFDKVQYKFCKTYLKFNKEVDEKNLKSFFGHN